MRAARRRPRWQVQVNVIQKTEPQPQTRRERRETQPMQPAKRARASRRTLVLAGAIAILLGWGTYELVRIVSTPTVARRSNADVAQSVGAAATGRGDIRVIVHALGTVTPLATVTVRTQISGQLTEVAFKEGDAIKTGDFLAQIDARPYQAALRQAQGQLAHDQGLLDQARADLVRYQNLAKTNAIPRQQMEDQAFLVTQAEGSVQTDQAQIEAQMLNIGYCHIVSPVDGRVGLRLVDPGNYVQITDTTGIAVVTQLQPISVVLAIPEDDLPEIQNELDADHKLRTTAFDRANVKQLAIGEITTLDNQIDTTTGTVKLRAQFTNTDNKLFPNQFVNVQILVRVLQGVVTVPTAAVQRGAPGAYVYVINPNHTVSVRPIGLGPTDGDRAEVTVGLAADERVVVDGADRLRDGAAVTIPNSGEGGAGGRPSGR
jgi:multidrug efflux system membrane fusion protein